jgi:hypothetical protein
MSINPFWSFGGSVPGVSGASTGAAGAGATAATAGLPWAIIIPIALSILGSIFEEEKDPLEEAVNLKKQMGILGFKPPYQSPYAKGLDPVVLQALMAQLGRTANWGWPGGMGMDTSFIEEALGKIGAGRFGASLPGAIRRR